MPDDLDAARQQGGDVYLAALVAYSERNRVRVRLPDGRWFKPRRWRDRDALRRPAQDPLKEGSNYEHH